MRGILSLAFFYHIYILIIILKNEFLIFKSSVYYKRFGILPIKYGALKLRKNNNTLIIIGSGPSLLCLSKDEIEQINKHDSMTLNKALFDIKFSPNYAMVQLSRHTGFDPNWNDFDSSRFNRMSEMPIILLRDLYTYRSVDKKFSQFLTSNKSIIRVILRQYYVPYRTASSMKFYLKAFDKLKLSDAIRSRGGALFSALYFAKKMDYKKIILVGFDLNSNLYFHSTERENHSDKPDESVPNKHPNLQDEEYGLNFNESIHTLISTIFKDKIKVINYRNTKMSPSGLEGITGIITSNNFL